MTSSLLWLPDDYSPGWPIPAFVFAHRWGGYPYDELARSLGPVIAERGFAFLSVCLRRRGMEGQVNAIPDNDVRDLKLAIDYLYTNGCSNVYLVGDELGCSSIIRYQATAQDHRVSGMALVDPVGDPAAYLRVGVGDDAYAAAADRAGIAVRQRAGMDVRIDLLPDRAGATVTQYAPMFLSWWGPLADTALSRGLERVHGAVLVMAEAENSLPRELRYDAPPEQERQYRFAPRADYAENLIDWATEHGAIRLPVVPLEPVQVESAGKTLFGLLWTPADGKRVDLAILLMHGLTSSPLSSLFAKMAPVLAQSGTSVLAMESQRSGFWGHETALLDSDMDDIDAWLQYLLERGYDRIVLAGASMGSLSIGRYQSIRQHPNVIALAHLMPTADCPEWFREAAGHEDYEKAVEHARAAVETGRGQDALIDIDVRQPPPSRFGSYFRWTQRAASWLSWWGPDADSRNSLHIANARVPILLLAGTDDSYNDEARFAELRRAAVNAPSVDEIWYPDVDHGLIGVEADVARDLIVWLCKLGFLDNAQD